MKKVIAVFLLAMVLVGCGSSGSEEKKADNLSYEFTTAGGLECKIYDGAPNDVTAAVMKTISEVVEDADASGMNPKDLVYYEYSDGMLEVYFPEVIVGEYEYGGECYLEFKDDAHKEFSVHYLQIANQEYINDGIDIEGMYGDAPEEE